MKKILVLGLAWFVAFAVPAASAAEKEKRWADEGEISFVASGGNTETTNLAAKNELRRRFTDSVRGTWKIGALYGKSGDVTTSESYATEVKLDYLFSNGVSAFAAGGWQQNTFAGIDRRVYGGLGAGYAFLGGPRNFLVGELGVNYTSDSYTDGTDQEYPEGRAFGKYLHAFTDKTKFSQSVEFLDDLKDTARYRLSSETAIIVALSGNLSLKTSYLVGYVNEPVPDFLKNSDSTAMATLVVTF